MSETTRDFYTKSEVDEKFGLSPSADGELDFYTKSEIIAMVGTPETLVLPSDMLDFYTKAEIDSIVIDSMPHMDGILSYFDCADGIGTEGVYPAWMNRVSGGSNMILHNASIAQDGAISFYGGNDSGNGRFSCGTNENATMYVLFKRTGGVDIGNYIHVCGSVANGEHFPYVGNDGSYWKYGVQFMLNKNAWQELAGLFQLDITNDNIRDASISCLDYHVVCCIRQKNGAAYNNIMYVDGTYIGRIDGTPYPPGTNYGVCVGVDSFGYEDATYDGYDTLIKMIAVGNQAHSAQQVAENSAWLLAHYGISVTS